MSRIVVQLGLAGGMPRPLIGRCPSLFGVWLRERIASIAIDWPAVGFHGIELLPDGVRLVLLARGATPSEVVGLAIARAVRVEVESAALAWCGLQRGTIWDDATVVIVERLGCEQRLGAVGWGLGAAPLAKSASRIIRQLESCTEQPQPQPIAPSRCSAFYDLTLASRITANQKKHRVHRPRREDR